LADRSRVYREAATKDRASDAIVSTIRKPTLDLSGWRVGDRYQLLRRIGLGSVGSVYEAVDERSLTMRPVAIKVLHADLTQEDADVQRFKREARAAAALRHEHIVEVKDFVADPGAAPCIVMEFLDGQTLQKVLESEGRITAHRAARIGVQVLSALDAAHRAKIVHRDIKPENVFLTLTASDADVVKVLDFGSAKLLGEATGIPLTVTGMVIGTLSFMPPEQALANRIDARADLYALAATLYAAVSGQPPFVATSPAAILAAVQHDPPRPLASLGVDVDPELDALIQKGLEKDPRARFQTAGEMDLALRTWLDNAPRETQRSPFSTIPPKPRSDPRVTAAPPRPRGVVPPSPSDPDTPPRAPSILPADEPEGRHNTFDGVSLDAPEPPASVQRLSSPAAPLAMPTPWSNFGRYRLHALLGSGGVGEVFRAEDSQIARHVALKVLRVARDAHEDGLTVVAAKRILHEARVAATIDHPNAVAIYDADTRGGLPYLVMELIDGRSFRDVVGDPLVPVERKVGWLVDIARAIAAAHKKGVVHRDIKPENVMLREADQVVKVLDFGIAQRMFERDLLARAEVTERIPGTPAYMAPEQMLGEEATPLSDQFSWGVFAYELLSGTLPWLQRGGMLHLVHQIMTRVPDPPSRRRPDVPPEIERVVSRALAKKAEDRFASMDDVATALVDAWVAAMSTSPVAVRRTDDKAAADAPGDPSKGRAPVGRVAQYGMRASAPRRWWRRRALIASAATIAVASFAVLPVSKARRSEQTAAGDGATDATTGGALDVGSTMSANPAAVAAYRAGMDAVHNAAGGTARKSFDQAIKLDPSFAAAHLRKVLATPDVTDAEREDIRKATQLRDTLGDHDRALLQAITPWVGVPRDVLEVERRLAALTAAQRDADYLYHLCRFRVFAGNYGGAIESCRAARAIDPKLAGAVWLEAQSWLALDDAPAGTQALDACLRLSPAATSCLNDLLQVEGRDGVCDAAFGYAQRLSVLEPDNSRWLEQLGITSYAVRQPIARAREAYDKACDFAPLQEAPVLRARGRFHIAVLVGDFDEAGRQLDALELATDGNHQETDHSDAFKMRALFQRELGLETATVGRARTFLASRAAWTPDPDVDTSIEALIALYRGGGLSRRAFMTARTEWLNRERATPRLPGRFGDGPGRRWIDAYARSVMTPEDAHDALSVLPDYLPLPPRRLRDTEDDEAIGWTFLLAGQPKDAVPFLRRAAGSCQAAQYPFQHTWANLGLGEALESSDIPGACAAYQVVLDRWATAAKSQSAHTAYVRRKALGCR